MLTHYYDKVTTKPKSFKMNSVCDNESIIGNVQNSFTTEDNMISLLHTPDGVRDLYGEELTQKKQLLKSINNTIKLYGFEMLDTPAFEYFDVFSKDIGTIPSKDLYKFFDKEGNTLVLRPDFTPSVARCAAKYFPDETLPLRFCYEGNTFVNTSELQGKLKETTEIGVELINDDSIYADAEVLRLVIESLKNVGMKDFQISIGESNYFKGICEEAKLDEETEMTLRDYISSKNFYGSRQFLSSLEIDDKVLGAIESISKVFLPVKDLKELLGKTTNERSKNAISRLIKINSLLALSGYERYVTYDLSMLSKYHYYTGIIFSAYTYGVGNPIVKGGRYDGLLEKFGKKAPSVGCVFKIDEIQTALRRTGLKTEEKEPVKKAVVYTEENYEKALHSAEELRAQGSSVLLILRDGNTSQYEYEKMLQSQNCEVLFYD